MPKWKWNVKSAMKPFSLLPPEVVRQFYFPLVATHFVGSVLTESKLKKMEFNVLIVKNHLLNFQIILW